MSKFESYPIVKAFRENLAEIGINGPISAICGVSGGVDSMVLLYLLHRFDINCTVAHCNYQLRGEESDKDMKLVEEMSSMWGFDCITARFDPAEADESNTQIWARDLRYSMFRDLKRELDADFIFTAHHKEDQIETILQKILRGSGMAAWSGMSVSDGDLIRPLLSASKKQIRDFAKSQHIPFREDETNQTSKYARNLIRNELAPELDSLIPGWRQNVLNIPEKADQFQIMTDTLLKQVEAGKASVNRADFLALPEKIWPALIHRFIETNSENAKITSGELGQVGQLADLQTGGELEFGNHIRLVRDREVFRLVSEESGISKPITISFNDLPVRSDDFGIRIELNQWDGEIKKEKLQIDAGAVKWPLTIRTWQDGDRIQPLGMDGSKLIADVLTDRKISSVQKKEAFLLESFDGIICAVIFPHSTLNRQIGVISDLVKCNTATKKILLIDTDV